MKSHNVKEKLKKAGQRMMAVVAGSTAVVGLAYCDINGNTAMQKFLKTMFSITVFAGIVLIAAGAASLIRTIVSMASGEQAQPGELGKGIGLMVGGAVLCALKAIVKHCVFPCGFKRQDTKPSELFSTDILTYRGNYYSLTKSRFPYEIDKTKNENCLILTLFAIAKELKERAREEKKNFDWKTSFGNFIGKDVVLAVGPHLEKQQEVFKKYFLDAARYGIEFHYNGKLFQFHIRDVLTFPQDYAAAVIYREALIKKYSSVYCIDIGDGTVDLLALKNGIPDKEVMVSRELGMAGLRAKIIDDVINDFGMTIDANAIGYEQIAELVMGGQG